MATRFYFHNATSGLANLPTAEQSSLTANASVDGATINRYMDPTIGAGPHVQKRITNTVAGVRHYYYTRFVSDEINQTSIAANTWSYNFACAESNAAADFPIGANTTGTTCVVCYVWRPSTQTKVGTILDSATGTATMNEAATGITVRNTTFSGSAVASTQLGDVIIFEMWFKGGQTTTTSRNMDAYYDGTTANTTEGATVTNHASFIETPENIVFGPKTYTRTVGPDTVAVSESLAAYKPGPATVKFGTITIDATSGAHTQNFTNELGFRPKGMILWSTGSTATGTSAESAFGIGLTSDSATGEMGWGTWMGDNIATTNNTTQSDPNQCLVIRDSAGPVIEAALNFGNNGFDVVYGTKTNTTQYKCNYFAFTAPSITNCKALTIATTAGTGNKDITTVGFQGNIVFFAGGYFGNNASTGANSGGFGVAMSSSKQWASTYAADNTIPSNTAVRQRSDRCFITMDTLSAFPNVVYETSFDSWLSNGLRLNWVTDGDTGDSVAIMVVQGGDWDLGVFNQPTSTGNQIVNTASDLNNKGVLFASFNNTSTTSAVDHERYSFGGGDGTNEAHSWIGATDNVNPTVAKKDHSESKAIRLLLEGAGGSTLKAEADLTSIATQGQYTLNWPTVDATAREVCWVSCGDRIVSGTNYTRTVGPESSTISDVSIDRVKSALRVPSTDSSTVSDSSLTRMLSASRAPGSDTISIADVSTTKSATRVRGPSTDSSTITDSSLVRMLSATRTPSLDTLTIGETPTRMLSAIRLPSTDSTTVADISITQAKAYTRTGGPDTTGVSDSSLTRLLSAIRVPGLDTVTVTAGTSTRMLSATRVPSLDTVATTEQAIGGKVYGRIPSTDTITIADVAITRLLSALRSPSDTTPSSENLIRILSAFRVPSSDTTTVADVTINRTRSLARISSDNTAVVDSSLVRLLQASRSPSQDTILVSDSSLVRLLSALRTVSAETITVNENITATQSQSLVRTASDNTAVTDGTLSRFLSATRVPSLDTVTVADASIIRRLQLVRLVGPDTIATSESISSALTTAGAFSRTASDTVVVTDSSLIRLLSSARTASDTSPVSESIVRSASRPRTPATDNISIADVSIIRVRSLTRLPTQDTMNIVEASLVRLLSLARSATDTTIVTEVQKAITHSRALQDTISVSEPLLQRIVSAARSVSDTVGITEDLFFQTYHKYVFDTVVVGEQLFRERTSLSGAVTYATPDEVRPLLGNLGAQKADEPIELAIDAAYDEINTKTNRIPPNDWKDTDHNFGIVKKLARYIAAKEVAIGIKDFDTKPFEMEIEHLFNDLLTYDTTSDATQDIVGSSTDETYALNEGGIIWSTRYRNLKKNTSNENSTTINPNT